jgi:hypothetical protein
MFSQAFQDAVITGEVMYEGCLKISWTGGSAPLLCRGRR